MMMEVMVIMTTITILESMLSTKVFYQMIKILYLRVAAIIIMNRQTAMIIPILVIIFILICFIVDLLLAIYIFSFLFLFIHLFIYF